MTDGFVCTYADILYRPHAVERLMRSRGRHYISGRY